VAETAETAGSDGWKAAIRPRLPLGGLVAGIWALLPPYLGPYLDTARRVEIADHVVPSTVVLLTTLLAYRASRRGASALAMLAAGCVVVLGGLWMTTTHLPLVTQASQGQAPGGAAAYHTAPGLFVAALGVTWVLAYWSDAA
jgi:hypothetical protein